MRQMRWVWVSRWFIQAQRVFRGDAAHETGWWRWRGSVHVCRVSIKGTDRTGMGGGKTVGLCGGGRNDGRFGGCQDATTSLGENK